MKNFLFILACLAIGLVSCKKEETPVDPDPQPHDTTPVYVPIYQPGDTSKDAAYAKKLTAGWSAEAKSRVQSYFDTNYVSISFLTYNRYGELRESMGFSFIPRFGGNMIYPLKKITYHDLPSEFVSASYGTSTSDGDVLEDYYLLDSTATDNHFTVVNLDLANKRIECTFTVTFNIVEPRRNPANPKTVKFSEGRAWAVIRD